jgi:capsular exopolysaccharide synthesis family protein
MSEIYEALKKAEREKGDRTRVTNSPNMEADRFPPPSGEASSSNHMLPAEEYRKMYNTLRMVGNDRTIRSVLILSSVHGEGTSSVCSQFARSVAQGEGEKVLLVDANLRNPTIHNFFDLEQGAGLVDLLEGRVSADEVIRETEPRGLSIVMAGSPTTNAPKLLGSSHLIKALEIWKERFSLVIFDTSPVLTYADAVVLGRFVDGVILVVHAGKTRWEVIQRAQEILKNAKANILGVVLNKRQYVIPKPVYRRL